MGLFFFQGSGSSPRVLSLGGLEEAAESVGNVRVKLNQECPDLKNKEEASSEGGESVTAVNKEPSEVLNVRIMTSKINLLQDVFNFL